MDTNAAVLQEVNHTPQLLYDFPWSQIGKLAFLVRAWGSRWERVSTPRSPGEPGRRLSFRALTGHSVLYQTLRLGVPGLALCMGPCPREALTCWPHTAFWLLCGGHKAK